MAIVPIVLMGTIPVFSIILGKIGMKGWAMFVSCFLANVSLGMMLLIPENN